MVIFLVGLVSMILMRTLRKDYARYSKDEEMDDMVGNEWQIVQVVKLTSHLTPRPLPIAACGRGRPFFCFHAILSCLPVRVVCWLAIEY